MKKLLKYLRPYRKETVISPLFKLLEAIFDLLVPLVVKRIIDVGIANADKPYVLAMCLVLVGFALVGLGCSLVAQYYAARAAVGFSTHLRRDLFAHIQRFSYTDTDRIGTATLITRMTADVNQVQSGVNLTLRLLLRSPIIVLGALVMALAVHPGSAWIFLLIIPLLAVVIFSIMLKSIPLYRGVQSNLDRVTALTRENLTGARVLRAFRKEDEEIARFGEANDAHNRIQNRVGRISALMNPLTLVLVNLGVILILQSGAHTVYEGGMTQGDVVALTNYMAQILVELIKLANTVFTVNKALASARRISDVLDAPISMSSPDNAQTPAQDTEEVLSFRNVSMRYTGSGEPSLSGITFSARRGETVGIIGSTGSGKSTLADLIPRFYDPAEGEVYVLGQDVRAYSLSDLRDRIAIVPQKATLFSGTVRSNLLWGNPDATDGELWEALERAQAKDFVEEKEGGLDAPVSQNGKNLSGGQRQRLTIARALVRRAPILILDDSSSALDYATDAALRHALHTLPDSPTVLLISQRTSSIRHADKILVLEDGECVGMGTHNELLATCEVYREIHESQYRREVEKA